MYVASDPSFSEEIVLESVLYNLAVIGEAVKELPDWIKALAPEADWSPAARMRDVVIHKYFATDRRIVATTVEKDLPALKHQIERLLGDVTP